MSELYDRLSATALALITKFGQVVTLITTTGVGTTTSRTAKGVFRNTVVHSIAEAGFQSSSNGVQIGDKEYLLTADAMPLLTDRIQVGNDSLVLMVPPAPISPGDTILGWRVWGRAG